MELLAEKFVKNNGSKMRSPSVPTQFQTSTIAVDETIAHGWRLSSAPSRMLADIAMLESISGSATSISPGRLSRLWFLEPGRGVSGACIVDRTITWFSMRGLPSLVIDTVLRVRSVRMVGEGVASPAAVETR